MKKGLLTLVLILASCATLFAQGRSVTFTSVTDAKFFVYLNGKLQNEHSTGMITLRDLEDKEYHVRIVIDDPFEVATTKRIRPDANGSEYTVRFNAVRERVDLKKSDSRSSRDDESLWRAETPESATPSPSESETPKKRTTIRHNTYNDTASQRALNSLKLIIEN